MNKNHSLRSKVAFAVLVVVLSAAAVWLFLYCTPDGVGLTNDSAAYLGGARSLLAGNGYVRFSGDRQPRPITQFPPLLSLILAGIAWLGGMDVFQAAKTLNLVCFVINLLLFIFLIRHFTKNRVAAAFAGMIYLACPPILQAHVYGLSEALYLVFFLSSMFFLEALTRKNARADLWAAFGIWLGLTMLTRYAGASILLAALLYSFAALPKWRSRFRATAGMLIGFLLTVSPWLIRNSRYTDSAVNRGIGFHFPKTDVIHEGVLNLTQFFLPERGEWFEKTTRFWEIFWAVVLLAAMIWTAVAFFRRLRGKGKEEPHLLLVALQTACYLAVLIVVALLVDGSTVFDSRMLLPFFVGACLLILLIFANLIHKKGGWRTIAVLSCLAFALFLLEDSLDLMRDFHRDGQGFASAVWRESEIGAAVNQLPESKTYYSNRQTYLWLMKNRPAYILPVLKDAATQRENESFDYESEQMQTQMKQGTAYAIVFNYQMMADDPSDKLWLDRLFENMPIFGEYADGIIFGKTP